MRRKGEIEMKTRIFTTILLFCFAVTGILADNLPTKVYVNEAETPSGLIKEFVKVNSETLDPLQKTVYMYGKCGKLQKKICYQWNEKEWCGTHKYEYEYDCEQKQEKNVKTMIYTKWDKRLNAWSIQSEQFLHIYSADGKLYAVKQIHVDKTTDTLIASLK